MDDAGEVKFRGKWVETKATLKVEFNKGTALKHIIRLFDWYK